MAEDAEDCSPGRAPSARAPFLSIHAFKVFEGPAERSMRRAPRPRGAEPRPLRQAVAVAVAVLRASALLRVKLPRSVTRARITGAPMPAAASATRVWRRAGDSTYSASTPDQPTCLPEGM